MSKSNAQLFRIEQQETFIPEEEMEVHSRKYIIPNIKAFNKLTQLEMDLSDNDKESLNFSKSCIDFKDVEVQGQLRSSIQLFDLSYNGEQQKIKQFNYSSDYASDVNQIVEQSRQENQQLKQELFKLANENKLLLQQNQTLENKLQYSLILERKTEELKAQLDKIENHLQISDLSNARLRQQMKDSLQRQRDTQQENQVLHSELMQIKLDFHEAQTKIMLQEKNQFRVVEKKEREISMLNSQLRNSNSMNTSQMSVTRERHSAYEPMRCERALRGMNQNQLINDSPIKSSQDFI